MGGGGAGQVRSRGHCHCRMRPPKGPWPDVPDQRRKIMAAIRGRDTKPELTVRSLLHVMGYRFKVNERRFGFRPDVLFTARRKVIFIHGCFWHGHDHATHRTPRTRSDFWQAKLAANRARDRRALEAFSAQDWESLVIWECEISNAVHLAGRLKAFLGPVRWPKVT